MGKSMSNKKNIEIKGKIASQNIRDNSAPELFFKDIKPGTLIIAEDNQLTSTVIDILNCVSTQTSIFMTVVSSNKSGLDNKCILIYDLTNGKYSISNASKISTIKEIIIPSL